MPCASASAWGPSGTTAALAGTIARIWNERYPDRGGDERFTGGRGGGMWRPADRGEEGGYLGQGGQQMGYCGFDRDRADRGDMSGGRGVQNQGGMYGQGGYNEGMYGRGGMQNRYGSQGYQGWGQQQHGMTTSAGHRGKGPSGYTPSDDRIREIVCEVLTDDDYIDATNIDVTVHNGEVTLSGAVDERAQKRMAEDRIENLSCVNDVVNQLRVSSRARSRSSSETSSTRGNGNGGTSDKRHRA